MKLWKRCCLVLLGIIVCIIIVGCITVQFTPKPVCHLTRIGFSGGDEGVQYGLHPNYEAMKENVQVKHDLRYPSQFENALYDLYVPKDDSNTYPLLIWVHGGAFVGGDKKDIASFATVVASHGYVVLCMNYALAPEYAYPTPLKQTIELGSELQELAKHYPIDQEQIFIGGDSAGAHIALQFVLTQINKEYQALMQVKQVLDVSSIKGFVSFCGLLDILAYDETDSAFSNFLYDQSAWGYFQAKDWKQAAQKQYANLLPYVNGDLPPVYVSDGDKNSFLPQAKKVKELLKRQGVKVSDLLWESGEHIHEYQFHLDQDAGLKNFEMMLEFLNECTME